MLGKRHLSATRLLFFCFFLRSKRIPTGKSAHQKMEVTSFRGVTGLFEPANRTHFSFSGERR